MHVVFDQGLLDLGAPASYYPSNPWPGRWPASTAGAATRPSASYLSRHPREALFHDAVEALLGDLNTPLKERFPQLRVYEEEVLEKIFTGMGLAWPLPQKARQVDARLAATESLQFFGIKSPRAYPLAIRPWPAQEAAARFIARARELGFEVSERNPYGMAKTPNP